MRHVSSLGADILYLFGSSSMGRDESNCRFRSLLHPPPPRHTLRHACADYSRAPRAEMLGWYGEPVADYSRFRPYRGLFSSVDIVSSTPRVLCRELDGPRAAHAPGKRRSRPIPGEAPGASGIVKRNLAGTRRPLQLR